MVAAAIASRGVAAQKQKKKQERHRDSRNIKGDGKEARKE
jgi:hypothetical protein